VAIDREPHRVVQLPRHATVLARRVPDNKPSPSLCGSNRPQNPAASSRGASCHALMKRPRSDQHGRQHHQSVAKKRETWGTKDPDHKDCHPDSEDGDGN